MAGTFAGTKPKAFNRHFWINIGTADTPEWVEICNGISSRGVDVSEDEEKYYYMCGRGSADVESSSQSITRTFTGNRFLGDPAQDAIFIDKMYTLDNRQVEYLDYYDNPPESWNVGKEGSRGNGYKGVASVKVSNDGGGDTGARESIGFSLLYSGLPTRGTVTFESSGAAPTFEALTP